MADGSVSVTTNDFATVLSSTDSIYNELVRIKGQIEAFSSDLASCWQGNGLADVQSGITTVLEKLGTFQETYERFGESLRVLGGNYNSLENEIKSSML